MPNLAQNQIMKKTKIPKIGKRGWLGVILFIVGLMTFIEAKSQADTESEQSSYDNGTYVGGVNDGIARDNGYGSFSDALAEQNRNSGIFFMCVGGGLFAWGYKRYEGKKPTSEQPQTGK